MKRLFISSPFIPLSFSGVTNKKFGFSSPKIYVLICFTFLFFITVLSFSHRTIYGIVIDEAGKAVEGARVRIQATTDYTLTDDKGAFQVEGIAFLNDGFITAGKKNYFNGGEKLRAVKNNYQLMLKSVDNIDHKEYQWTPPHSIESSLEVKIKPCKSCHPELHSQWAKSSHSLAAVNPVFITLFSGVKNEIPFKKGLGFKNDFPQSNGTCVACHVPAMALKDPFGSNLMEATNIDKEGIFCDFCHKITGAFHDTMGGRPGVLSMEFTRPPIGGKQFFGPLDDVFPGPDSFSPLHSQSIICAPCHSGKFWGNKVYTSFDEWVLSPSAKKGETCQDCHMKPEGNLNHFAKI
ncbi:MAG: hypothetical protein HQK84_09605 [Nitrospinae bacterium]|nr:hypothetical protein [Nitrospinota bacterium]